MAASEEQSLELKLARAAAAFKDADFFESNILFWSAALESTERELLEALAAGLDLEQDLGLDVQLNAPIDLVFPRNVSLSSCSSSSIVGHLAPDTISSIHTYILTALCYLSRHINIRMDILPSGQDTTLTSLGSPQRYYGSLTPEQRQVYHAMLAIVLATASSIPYRRRQDALQSHQQTTGLDEQLRAEQATIIGNECTSPWQTILPRKKSPHALPRFFSFLNPSSCTVAGASIPRNETDIEALEQAGFKLVVTLIKESPLPPSWFLQQGPQSQPQGSRRIRNAFVPIENRKAPRFPEVFEVVMGWCVLAEGKPTSSPDGPLDLDSGGHSPPHQNATLIHCGGGKGRAGIMLASHLIRFGLVGHEMRGYCAGCVATGNIHRFDLDIFKKGLGDKATIASTLPTFCVSFAEDDHNGDQDQDEDEDEDESDDDDFVEVGHGVNHVRLVRKRNCLNRFQPQMTAKDAIAHLRDLRPGSIESVEQEKAVKAYGDWLWKRASSKSSKAHGRARYSSGVHDTQPLPDADSDLAKTSTVTSSSSSSSTTTARAKGKKEKKNDTKTIPKGTVPASDAFSDNDSFDRGERKGGKKGKKGRHAQPDEPPVFVPPPAHKIIKLPGSGKGSHHQHHLVVQHNMRAKLQRGQKVKKGGHGGKTPKERPSFHVSGSPLDTPPRLIILTGLPGSGKSHLVTSLLQEFPDHFVRISQDELGSRSVCERLLAQSMRHQQQSLAIRGPTKALPMTIFVDRCNPTASERKEWYEVAFQPDNTVLVWFSMSADKCIERASAREGHPTVSTEMAPKVVKSFAASFEAPQFAKESWCSTLVEIGDDAGSDQLYNILCDFAKEIQRPGTGTGTTTTTTAATTTPIKARPAFIPARALQRKNNGATSVDGGLGSAGSLSSKLPQRGTNMAILEEEEDQEEEDEDEEEGEDEDEEEGEDEKVVDEASFHDGNDSASDSDNDNGNDNSDSHTSGTSKSTKHSKDSGESVKKKNRSDQHEHSNKSTTGGRKLKPESTMSITKALQFAAPTGHRPAVKKPAKGSWRGLGHESASAGGDGAATTVTSTPASPKGVSFASPLSSYDRPLQKFPRTPHLFDPLTIRKSRELGSDKLQEFSGSSQDAHVDATSGRNTAISRSDLLLPPSALDQILVPKPHQVLTVEEKMDGANIGFSVLHFKSFNYGGSHNGAVPLPKIRVQNRNHFVHPDDHWQFKKLNIWLERHRDDILWLCEGRWRHERRRPGGIEGQEGSEDDEKQKKDEVADDPEDDENYEDVSDSEDNENEYVDENKVLQDGMAPYVLYGEWLYAKHSVQYTGLGSWFVPFDLLDVKTGTFVSRSLFRKAIQQTQMVLNPVIDIPEHVSGDVDKMLDWTLEKLHSRSMLMKKANQVDDDRKVETNERVEGLYFRVDQGDRLLTRCKVVRPDFIAGEERWGAKEQLANILAFDAHYSSGPFDDNDEEDEEESGEE
ncbi:Dual specificity protein phosphatase 23 [Podila epigama]|nr:Dual specificity protein phosphatase 23 [Podila epigama]